MGVRLALGVAKEWGDGAVAASDSVSQLEVAEGRGCVDGVVVVEGEDRTERAVDLSRLVRLGVEALGGRRPALV